MSLYPLNEFYQTYRLRRRLLSAGDSSFWNKESVQSGLDTGASLYPYSLIEPVALDRRPDLGLEFLKEELKNSVSLEDKHIQEHIKLKRRAEVLKKLHRSIDNLNYECEEEGFASVSDTAKESAKRILNAVYKKFPDYEYHIYPAEDREIAVDCNPQKGKGALILCDSEGGAAYFSTLDGKNTRFRCDCISDFAYEHLWKIFGRFDQKKIYRPVRYAVSDSATESRIGKLRQDECRNKLKTKKNLTDAGFFSSMLPDWPKKLSRLYKKENIESDNQDEYFYRISSSTSAA